MTISKPMSFKIRGWKKIIPKVIWIILGALLLGFFIKVAIWEHVYYNKKEGTIREITTNDIAPEQELIEIKPTELEIAEYNVEPDKPRYLFIEKLGIGKSRIIPVGVTADNALSAPSNIFDVGWYDVSAKPGQGGTMVLDGHSGGPTEYGIFKDLVNLVEGDVIIIERGDGNRFYYEVKDNETVALSEANEYMRKAMTTPIAGQESLSIISCAGEWSNVRKTFLSRQFVRAVLVGQDY